MGEADLVIGCDAIVTAGDDCASRMRRGDARRRQQRANADRRVHQEPELAFPGLSAENDIRAAAGEAVDFIDANRSPSRCSAMRSTRTRSCSATRGRRAGCRCRSRR
jgi:hypothetical protein